MKHREHGKTTQYKLYGHTPLKMLFFDNPLTRNNKSGGRINVVRLLMHQYFHIWISVLYSQFRWKRNLPQKFKGYHQLKFETSFVKIKIIAPSSIPTYIYYTRHKWVMTNANYKFTMSLPEAWGYVAASNGLDQNLFTCEQHFCRKRCIVILVGRAITGKSCVLQTTFSLVFETDNLSIITLESDTVSVLYVKFNQSLRYFNFTSYMWIILYCRSLPSPPLFRSADADAYNKNNTNKSKVWNSNKKLHRLLATEDISGLRLKVLQMTWRCPQRRHRIGRGFETPSLSH